MRGKRGFTLVEILIVLTILGLVIAIVVPNFIRARRAAGTNVCIANLRHIDDAKAMWAVWEGMGQADVPGWDDLIPDYLRDTPVCPTNGTYTVNNVGTAPTCTEDGHVLVR